MFDRLYIFGSDSVRGQTWYNDTVRDEQWGGNENDKIFWVWGLFYQRWMVGWSHEWFWSQFAGLRKKKKLKWMEKKRKRMTGTLRGGQLSGWGISPLHTVCSHVFTHRFVILYVLSSWDALSTVFFAWKKRHEKHVQIWHLVKPSESAQKGICIVVVKGHQHYTIVHCLQPPACMSILQSKIKKAFGPFIQVAEMNFGNLHSCKW